MHFTFTEDQLLQNAKPGDFSFKQLKELKPMGVEGARSTRIGTVPERGSAKKKLLTKSLWLNNNKLKHIKNMDQMVESVLEVPEQLGWIDFSFNFITTIDESILKFPNLKIIYFHGNCINSMSEVFRLRKLSQLRTVTFHGNPISNFPNYRISVIALLPQILNLDFTPVLANEKLQPPPTEILKIIRGEKK